MADWSLNLDLDGASGFPSLVAMDCYRLLSTATELELRRFEPDPAGPEVDAAAAMRADFSSGLTRPELRDRLRELLRGVRGLRRVRLRQTSTRPEQSPIAVASTAGLGEITNGEDHVEPSAPETVPSHSSFQPGSGYIRISLAKVDQLVNLIGELVISKSRLDLFHSQLAGDGFANRSARATFESARSELEIVTRDLQDLSLGMRLVPIRLVYTRLPALTRDLARRAGKHVELSLRGGETELDKVVQEGLFDPLLHLLRNAIDHGIEAPNERVRAGKDQKGRVLVQTAYEGDAVVVIVEDDGRGIDAAAIRERAVARRLTTPEEAERATPEELMEYIFRPGFSTAPRVTDVSGRGVGMDVARNQIARIGGSIDVASGPGIGTRFTIRIPLTLSIVESLLISSAGRTFALPVLSIRRISEVTAEDLTASGSRLFASLDGEPLRVLALSELFGDASRSDGAEQFFLIEHASGKGHFAIAAEQIIGRQDVVVKSLGDFVGRIPGISGGTILGDGRVALLLDVQELASITARADREVASR